MLAALGLVAVFFAWCASLRDRADVQDALIAEMSGDVYLERYGPKWLDLVGADRFRRRIVGARSFVGDPPFGIDVDEFVRRLARLPALRYLEVDCDIDQWTPRMAAALGDMGQLRILVIGQYDNSERIPDELLAAIGELNQLEVLSLDAKITSDDLPRLAGLTNLKALRIENRSSQYYKADVRHYSHKDEPEFERLADIGELPLLAHLPALPRLECLCFPFGLVQDRDVRHLTLLPRLKSLDLGDTFVTDAALAELASLESLEELAIEEVESEAGCESLPALKRLKALHIEWGYQCEVGVDEVDPYGRALEALRRSNPGIVIDNEAPSFEKRFVRRGCRFDREPQPLDRGLPRPFGQNRER